MYPYLVAAQALPVLAIVPLINSVFGGGMGARIFVCVMISIFPIVTNTLFGLTSVDTRCTSCSRCAACRVGPG